MYQAHPQDNPNDDNPGQMSVEDIVIGAEDGDINCLEWLGRPLPELRQPAAVRFPVCCRCGLTLPFGDFPPDNRKKNGRASICRKCDNRRRTRNRPR